MKHHLAGHHQLDGATQIARRSAGEQRVRPWKQFAAEPGAKVLHDHAHLIFRHAEHQRHDLSLIDNRLRCFVERIICPVECGDSRVQFDRVVRLDRRGVGLIDLERSGGIGEGSVNVASLRIDRRRIFRRHLRSHIGLARRIAYLHRAGRRGCLLEGIGDHHGNVLAVVVDGVILERRAFLVDPCV
jgi:hypothetical protein